MTLKTLVILIVVAAGAYVGYTQFVPQDKVNEAVGEATEVDHYDKGAAAFTGGLWDKVIEHYTAALAEEPNDERAIEAQKRIARAYEKSKQVDKAIKAYEAFLSAHPNDPDASKFRDRVVRMKQLQ